MSIKQVQYIIEKQQVDILFFDIFDTIITRKVHPEYVKKIFSKKIQEKYNINKTVLDVYLTRNEIESSLCQENELLGFDKEFKFKNLIEQLFKTFLFNNLISKDITFEKFSNYCIETEIEIEKKAQVIDEDVIELAKYAKSHDVKTVCVSDFYLDKNSITELFKYHQIETNFDEIFVSSDYLFTKKSGRFFEKLTKEYFPNMRIAMIGDNEHSDYKMPKNYGIESFHLDRREQFDFYSSHEKKIHNTNYIEKRIDEIFNQKQEKKINFQEMSLTLFYFCYKLNIELLTKDIKNIFFLSREGKFLKKIFDNYLKVNNLNQNINTHYLIVSRKSTFICSLKEIEEETFETLFRQYISMSILDFLKNLNFNTEQINQIAHHFSIEEEYENFKTSIVFTELKNSSIFQEIYETNRTEQRNNIVKYIKSFGFSIEKEGINLVDAGWKGTMQDHIYKVFNSKIHVNGYYIGLVTDMMPKSNNIKKGLIFDYRKKDNAYNVFSENTAIYEVLLGASHGSANCYVSKNNKIEVLTYEEEKEKLIYQQHIKPIQKVMYSQIHSIISFFDMIHFTPIEIENYVLSKHSRMIHYPIIDEVRFFKKLYHFENFGKFEYSEFSDNVNKNIVFRIKNFVKFLKNPRKILNQGFWKAATLDDLGLFFLYPLYVKYREYKSLKLTNFIGFNKSTMNSKELKNLKSNLDESYKAINNQDKLIKERDEYIKELELKLNEYIDAVENQDRLIEERDNYIKESEKSVK